MSTIADLPEGWTRVREPARVRWTRGGIIEAEAAWHGPWSSYAAFLKAVGGLEQTITYPSGQSVSRIVPLKYPSSSPDFDDVYAVDCELTPVGLPSVHDAEEITYQWALARIYFTSQAAYNFGSDYPLVSYSFSAGADFITRPGTAYEFPSDSLRLNQDVGVLVPWRDFTLTFHGLRQPNEGLYDSLAGRVNSEDFYHPNGEVYGPGYIQYLGPSGQYNRTIGNVETWTVTHRLKLRYIKHNEVMRPDGSGFEAPILVGGTSSDTIIPAADLMQLYAG